MQTQQTNPDWLIASDTVALSSVSDARRYCK